MKRDIFITGGSGALGPHLIAELLRNPHAGQLFVLIRPCAEQDARFRSLLKAVQQLAHELDSDDIAERISPLVGDITEVDLGLSAEEVAELQGRISVAIHAAADTRFAAAARDLQRVNVQGTRHVIEFARGFPQLRQLLFVSTTCVAGKTRGLVSEELLASPPEFVNDYERSKWEAERLVARSDLPARIARLSTCIGGAANGYVHRFGAIHHLLRWFERGLVPLVPGEPDTPIDLLVTDTAARWLAHAATSDPHSCDVFQIAAGDHAIPLSNLLDLVVRQLSARAAAWQRQQFEPPVIVDLATYEKFQRSVVASRDALFCQVMKTASSFLPALIYPKQFQMNKAEALSNFAWPQFDLHETLGKVIDYGFDTRWGARSQFGDDP